MVKYYFIPKSYEFDLADQIELWAQTPESYIVLTGVYKPNAEFVEGITKCFNLTISGVKTYIPKSTKGEDSQISTYIGFLLEADLQTIAPEFQALIDTLTDILQFPNSRKYLEWYNGIIS